MNIQGTKILITGGSLGIGRITAELLIKKGAEVIITGRNKERLEEVAHKIGAIPFVADVSDPEMIKETYLFIQETWGKLDCLINNAGIGSRFSTLADVTEEEFLEVYKVNRSSFKSFFTCGGGNIYNISIILIFKNFRSILGQ